MMGVKMIEYFYNSCKISNDFGIHFMVIIFISIYYKGNCLCYIAFTLTSKQTLYRGYTLILHFKSLTIVVLSFCFELLLEVSQLI